MTATGTLDGSGQTRTADSELEITEGANVLGDGIAADAARIMRWWQDGHRIESIGDLIYWNTLCRTAARKRARGTIPERLAIAVKLAWLELVDPYETDVEQIGKLKLGETPNAKTVAGKNQNWLDLVRDARASVNECLAGASVQLETDSAALGKSDAQFVRELNRRRGRPKKGKV